MKIAIIGYGKMGKAVESSALSQQLEVSQIITSLPQLQSATFANDEVAIEFTNSNNFLENIRVLSSKNVKIVSGTTGWDNNFKEVQQIIENSNSSFLFSSNFSIGIYAFWQAVQVLAQIFNDHEEYDVMIQEWHHALKKDSPSGTAIKTAELIMDKLKRKTKILGKYPNRALQSNELQISATRGGDACNHNVIFDSPNDTLQVSHQSKGRKTFADGAIKCAKWLAKQPNGFYKIDDYLHSN